MGQGDVDGVYAGIQHRDTGEELRRRAWRDLEVLRNPARLNKAFGINLQPWRTHNER